MKILSLEDHHDKESDMFGVARSFGRRKHKEGKEIRAKDDNTLH